MKVVIDTNVIAYFLLDTQPFAGEARSFLAKVTHGLAPALLEAELSNVIWLAIRAGVLPAEEGPRRLGLANQLGVESVPLLSLSQGALQRSILSGVAVCDTCFVELAVRERCPLATFDKALWKAFPGVAVRPSAITR